MEKLGQGFTEDGSSFVFLVWLSVHLVIYSITQSMELKKFKPKSMKTNMATSCSWMLESHQWKDEAYRQNTLKLLRINVLRKKMGQVVHGINKSLNCIGYLKAQMVILRNGVRINYVYHQFLSQEQA